MCRGLKFEKAIQYKKLALRWEIRCPTKRMTGILLGQFSEASWLWEKEIQLLGAGWKFNLSFSVLSNIHTSGCLLRPPASTFWNCRTTKRKPHWRYNGKASLKFLWITVVTSRRSCAMLLLATPGLSYPEFSLTRSHIEGSHPSIHKKSGKFEDF